MRSSSGCCAGIHSGTVSPSVCPASASTAFAGLAHVVPNLHLYVPPRPLLLGEVAGQTAWGYVLCGRARGFLGDAQQGLEDVRTGLSLIEKTVGTHVSLYFASRLVYADVLSAAGSRKESKAVREATLLSLQAFLRGKASESVISADAFR